MTGVLTRRWEIVDSLSSASFGVRNFGVRTVRGQVPIRQAWVDVDSSGRPVAVHAELDLDGIVTGHSRRDHDVRKPNLLDTPRFPTLTFTGRAGDADGEGWQLPGRLAGHGAETEVVLAISTSHGGDSVAAHAATAFDRRELGIRAPRVLIGRRIDVTIEAVLRPA